MVEAALEVGDLAMEMPSDRPCWRAKTASAAVVEVVTVTVVIRGRAHQPKPAPRSRPWTSNGGLPDRTTGRAQAGNEPESRPAAGPV